MSRRKKKKRKLSMYHDHFHNPRFSATPFNPPTIDPSSSGVVRIRVELKGTVQGVSCRARIVEIVRLLERFGRITGFVLNSPSSWEMVVLHAQGTPDLLNRLLLLIAYELRTSLSDPLVPTPLAVRPERGFYARGLLNYSHSKHETSSSPDPADPSTRPSSRERLEKMFHDFH